MFDPAFYTMIATLFPRMLGFVYFFAFGAFIFQIQGLIGSNGILPVKDYLFSLKSSYPRKCYFYAPSLFWFNASDMALEAVVAMGTVFSVGLMMGFYPSLMLLLLYIFYLSIVSVGQDFLSFGWEGFLLEITFYTFFMTLTPVPNLMIWVCLNVLLFRFHFQAGAVKFQSRDPNWSNLKALAFHYQTQPLPNTIAWYAHKLPMWFHQASAALMFIIEIIIPFGILGTEEIRAGVFFAFFGLQYMIWLTGNFSFLNYLTAIFSTILLSNTILSRFISYFPPEPAFSVMRLDGILFFIGSAFTILQLMQLWYHFFPTKRLAKWLYWFSPFHLVNPYGIFAVMTTKRYEIIIEGSLDGKVWKEYTFKYKPSEVNKRPKRISPYQPRLDWQVWFLPFTDFSSEPWFQHFLYHLLKGTPSVLKLIRDNPFADHPPTYIRAELYDYVFSDYQKKKEEKVWWIRTYAGPYSPILSLKGRSRLS